MEPPSSRVIVPPHSPKRARSSSLSFKPLNNCTHLNVLNLMKLSNGGNKVLNCMTCGKNACFNVCLDCDVSSFGLTNEKKVSLLIFKSPDFVTITWKLIAYKVPIQFMLAFP